MSPMEIVGWDKITYNVFLNIGGKNINTSIVSIDSYHFLKPFAGSYNKNEIKKASKWYIGKEKNGRATNSPRH